mmetsp:Transcript_27354/g.40385  ORF Transcript_27354/g.40385 Transcript_27354/m.40385 type:complete len:454 (+) Transcript_27354:169-1530(+)|eukprot:CAMPEP_0194223346 /NCGR_PEP_ID=MMETSP0156-20130528/34916_1 /TAXON_ID=33649 /ORGANISM="Thalassionema nitzschioides, Strain L26-B" /LENGTH=453 /DNA_ID=CAMNT_0038954453 /DNA_START=119 /DNA_END=1480 /DNA_ORIENTATION=-
MEGVNRKKSKNIVKGFQRWVGRRDKNPNLQALKNHQSNNNSHESNLEIKTEKLAKENQEEEEQRTKNLEKKAFARSIFVPNDVHSWDEPALERSPFPITHSPVPVAKLVQNDETQSLDDSKGLHKKPKFRLDFNNNGHTTPKELPINLDQVPFEPPQQQFPIPRCPSRVFCERRASIVSDITTTDFFGKPANVASTNDDSMSTLGFMEKQPRERSNSLTNFENLQQVMEFFPSVQKSHVQILLRKNSIRTAMNILAEESNPNDFPIPDVMERIESAEIKNPNSEAIRVEPIEGSEFAKGPTMVSATDNPSYPPEFFGSNGPSPMETNLNEDERISSLAQTNPYLPFSKLEEDKDLQQAIKYPTTSSTDCTSQEKIESDGPLPMDILLNGDTGRSSLSRANSYISFSEFEKEHKDLQQAMEIFPNGDKARVNFLLRQHTLGTVLVMLASESECE